MLNPAPHQLRALKALRGAAPGSPLLVNMATGTGKTLTAGLWVAEQCAKGFRGWWVVDRLALQAQAARELRQQQPQLTIKEGREALAARADLAVMTVQGLGDWLDEMPPPPDFVVIDEAHRDCTNSLYDRVYEYCRRAVRIGLSATPYNSSGQDMVDLGKWSGYAIRYTLTAAITDGVLCPVRVRFVPIDCIKLKDMQVKGAGQINEKQLLEEEVLHKMAMHITELPPPSVVFCRSIHHSKALEAVLKTYESGEIRHVDCYQSDHKNGKALDEFRKGKIKRALNFNLWGYGVDLPGCASVVFAGDKGAVAYAQALGRVVRWCCRRSFQTHGRDCECGMNKKQGWMLDFYANHERFGDGELIGQLAPELSATQREQVADALRRGQTDPFEAIRQALAAPMVERAAHQGSVVEESELGNPLSALASRLVLIGYALPPLHVVDRPATEAQKEVIRQSCFYEHETAARGRWVDVLSERQAADLVRVLVARQTAGRAEPRLLWTLGQTHQLTAAQMRPLRNVTADAAREQARRLARNNASKPPIAG